MANELRWRSAEIGGDWLEPVIDSMMNSGILRDIPLLGSFIKVAQLSRSVGDRIFLTKVQAFLGPLATVEPHAAEAFAKRMEEEPEIAERTGQTLLLAIDAINDLDKAPILAVVFHAYLRGEISLDIFLRLSTAVNLAMVSDLWSLVDVSEKTGTKEDRHAQLSALYSLRLTGLTSLSERDFAYAGKTAFMDMPISSLGRLLVDILRTADRPVPRSAG